jgi:anti-sigma factor RsiW
VRHPEAELTAYLDGALPPDARASVERHLAACARCRAERDRLAAAIALLARLPPAPAPSPTFEQRFQARLAAEGAGARAARGGGLLGRLSPRWLVPSLAGAAAAAAVLVLAGRGRPRDEAFLAEHLDLFESYEAVASVGAVDRPEDVDVVAHLDELERAP